MTTPRRTPCMWLAVACMLAVLLPARALAVQGINLSWDHCFGDGPIENKAFACDTNTGSDVMTGSFVLATDMALFIGDEIVVQLASASPALPDWWQFINAGACRQNSLSMNFSLDPGSVVCVDWSSGQMRGGLAGYCTINGPCIDNPTSPNEVRIKMIEAVQQELATTLVGGVEYFVFNLRMNHSQTIGPGACSGCEIPVCIVFDSINLVARDNVEMRLLSTPVAPMSNAVTWQGGGVPVTAHGTGCPAATPVRAATWGSLKALYR